MRDKTIIRETEHFILTVGTSLHHADTPNLLIYQVINKEYGVVEMESSALVSAMRAMRAIQNDLEEELAPVPDEESYLGMTNSLPSQLN